MVGRGGIYDGRHGDGRPVKEPAVHAHKWDNGREIGRTGDWFHPLIVEYRCICGATKTEDV